MSVRRGTYCRPRHPDEEAMLELHRMLRSGAATAESVRSHCDAHPQSARRLSCVQKTALHVACRAGADFDVVRYLYEHFPDAVAMKDQRGRLPLHDACRERTGPDLEVVRFLAERHHGALAERDDSGRTPLHFACIGRPSFEDLLLFLGEECPGSIRVKDRDGWFPLHLACSAMASLKVIAFLADNCPEALGSANRCGNTPLHLACYRRTTPEVIKLLIERCPMVLEIQNFESNHTPLERAIYCRESAPDVVTILSALHSLGSVPKNDPQVMDTLRLFNEMKWLGGLALVLDTAPEIVNKMEENLLPNVLAFVGKHCVLNTFYAVLQNNPAMAQGAVKLNEAELPPLE